ncbi:MAG: penicillin-binding protein 1A [Pseudomonadota bacterium]
MPLVIRLIRYLVHVGAALFVAGAVVAMVVYVQIAPQLPSSAEFRDIELQVPLRVYTRDGQLIEEFGLQRRIPTALEDIPPEMVRAFMAAEDARYYEHPGMDYQGILRAVVNLVATGDRTQGGSTITMQVARNFYLSPDRTYLRKLQEIILAFRLEQTFDKESILELYLNKIYMGNRAYGIGAAARVYYGTTPDGLNLAQMAMIAGLPKAPSSYNPIADPERATIRRNHILRRMAELGYVEPERVESALAFQDDASQHGPVSVVKAPHVAEMVRKEMLARHGERAYTGGFRVFTTLDGKRQNAANSALRHALHQYEFRHGYRGRVGSLSLDLDAADHYWLTSLWFNQTADDEAIGFSEPLVHPLPQRRQWQETLADTPAPGDLTSALVLHVRERQVLILLPDGRIERVPWEGLAWARRHLAIDNTGPDPETAADVAEVGDIIHVRPISAGAWHLANVPEPEGALVAVDPENGAISALAAGFDFNQSQFNRVTQSQRQPGSAFKPFIYSAALDRGYTAATIVNDAPVVLEDSALEGVWRPENYSGLFFGPTRLRTGLVHSRNLVSIRLLRSIGIGYAIGYARLFGFDTERLPRDLTLALGSGAITPLELATGYAVFANGGYRIQPHFIARIEDRNGQLLEVANPVRVCPECEEGDEDEEESFEETEMSDTELADLGNIIGRIGLPDLPIPEPEPVRVAERVIPADNAYLIDSMLRDVVKRGTGRGALTLGRDDLAGKTGTTNQQVDAWFTGYNHSQVAIAWMGYDTPRSMGSSETGARAALPMWIEYMRHALDGVPEKEMKRPPGLVSVRIDPETGRLASSSNPDAIFETFRTGRTPPPAENGQGRRNGEDDNGNVTDDLF